MKRRIGVHLFGSLASGLRGRLTSVAILLVGIGLTTFTPTAEAAISYVQGNYATPQSSQATVTVTFASAQTPGDLNVVVVGWNDSTAVVSSIADSSGNTYTRAVGPATISGVASQSIYYSPNIKSAAAGANIVTVIFSTPAVYADIRILEYSGVSTTTPVDVTASATGTSGTNSSGTATTTNASDLIFGANLVTGVTTAPGSGFTQRILTSPDGDIAEDKLATATGSYAATATASGDWIMQMVAFEAAGSGTGTAPAITSASSATFTVGSAGSFTVTTTGSPTPSITATGTLPGGVTFTNNGNGTASLSGAPAAGSGTSYPLTITATNGVGTNATQSFTLTVDQAPAITSPASTTFVVGSAGSFTVTTTGNPSATLSESGTLPSGVTLKSNGNGTATLSGTPTAGANGSYPFTITATNGVGTPATQSFTLTVSPASQAPAITSASSTTFAVGSAGTFTVTTTGTPTPSLSESGALPSGVTFTSNNNGTATLGGTPGAGTAGGYAITITATNGVGTNATQSFTLTVNQAPAITSAASTAFTVGTAGSFKVTTTGSPTPSITESGTLPTGVTFTNGSGTATLSGTPAAGTAGSYALTITASNGVGTNATQSFTLTVNQAPAITSGSSTTFVVGTAGSFTVTTTGSPTPSITKTGTLPSGVAFTSNSNGTATLSGTPAAGTAGSYALTITATNGVGTNATQSFTLTVSAANQAPAITSANATTFTVGGAGNFTVTATGTPTPSITQTGTLPSGVTFTNNGNGTATFGGTPATGTAGSYSLTITATNGVGTPATQSFTLTIITPAAIGFVQVNSATPQSVLTPVKVAYSGAQTAGDLNVVVVGWNDSTAQVSSVTDSKNNTYFLAVGPTIQSGTATQAIYYAMNIAAATAGSNAVTVTFNVAAAYPDVRIAEYTGINPTSAVDVAIAAQGTGTPSNSGSVTTGNANDLLVGANLVQQTTTAAGTGFTSRVITVPDADILEDSIVTVAGSHSATAPVSSGAWIMQMVAFRAAGSGGTGTAPAITSSNSAAFTVGAAGSFTVTTTGSPTPSITESGTLPTGVTFTNGSGTATLSGTPAAGTAGSYALTITASNGVGTNATQSFTLTVNQAPAITSGSSTTFVVGTAGSFTVTTTGSPTPSITKTGTLPSGVAFTSNSNGTATLSGTPAAGTAGSYALTITATNGVGTNATQSFTLTVSAANQAPAITSANATTFTVGGAGNFTVTATGTPTPSITQTGTLPSGVTFTNNGNGTAALGGTPATGTNGTYTLGITATNGVGTPATQTFTLTVQLDPPPTTPTNLTATAVSGSQINLSWTASTDDVGVTGYLIEDCEGVGCSTFARIVTVPGTTYSVTGLTANTSYTFQVKATDAAGNFSPYSNQATATTLTTVSGLVAAYSFDEGTGTTVNDLSGNGNTGTVVNGTWTSSAKYGNALVFNGTNSLVTIPNSASLQLSTGMTLEAWVHPSVVGDIWTDVIYKYSDNYYLEATSNQNGVPGGGNTIGSADTTILGTTLLTANTWTHLALTYDGLTLRLYVNGVQVSSLATPSGAMVSSTNPLQIGGDSFHSGSQYFTGTIDEVRVYNVALNETQIQSDMNTPVSSGSSLPLVSFGTSSIAFGNQATGSTSSSQPVTLTNVGGASLAISGIAIGGANPGDFAETNNCPSSLAPNGSCTINVTFSPANTGAVNSLVQISDNAPGSPQSVALSGTGIGFGVTPHASVLTFTGQQQFSAGTGSITWSVDGLVGGSSTVGTITSGGLYTPPSAVGTHVVTATLSTQSASATVYVSNDTGTYTFHNDAMRSGQNLNETALTVNNVNDGQFGKLFSYSLDGLSYASPLYVANVNIPGQGYHNVVYVATEHDSIYAFDADGRSTTPLWKTSFLGTGVTSVPCNYTCSDIPTEFGVTGTPVIDPTSNTLYVVAYTQEGTNYVQRLHALDITTGADKFGGPVAIQASVGGAASDSQGGVLTFNPFQQNQRPALLLSNGVVYISWGSHEDSPPWHGWIIGYNATTLQQTMVYCTTPDGLDGGIWETGGPGADSTTGDLFLTTGNGDFNVNTGGRDYGDSLLKVGTTGSVVDYFTPHNQAMMQTQNTELASAGPVLLVDQPGTYPHLLVAAGKTGTIFVINRDNLGQYNPNNDDQVVQSLISILPNGTQETGNYSAPVYFNGYVYFGAVSDNLKAFQLTNGLLSLGPTSQSPEIFPNRGGSFSISANGSGNGIIWAVQNNSPANGILYAYDAGNLSNELYNSNQVASRDALGVAMKMSVPVVANGKVFVIANSQLAVYGLLP